MELAPCSERWTAILIKRGPYTEGLFFLRVDWASVISRLVFTKTYRGYWAEAGWTLRNTPVARRHYNNLTKHTKNYNTKCTIDQHLGILRELQVHIRAIIYFQRLGAQPIFDDLKKLNVLIIDVIKQLMPRQKTKDSDFTLGLVQLHSSTTTKFKILKKRFNNQTNLNALVRKKQSKTRKRLTKKQQASWRKRSVSAYAILVSSELAYLGLLD